MIEDKIYTKNFFTNLETNSYQSAKKVLPFVNEMFHPKSVIDVGCGTGEWLKVWMEDFGVSDIKGVEGPYIKNELVKIDLSKLVIQDLKSPYKESKKYDMAMSLEVGEHLPTDCSEVLVKTLVQLSNLVFFSAAIPGQEGTYHINEQYPEFWASIFKKFNYVPIDFLREKIWSISGIEYWYKQNCMFFINQDVLSLYTQLVALNIQVNPQYLFRIHPDLYENKIKRIKATSTLIGLLKWKWVTFKYKYLKKP